jgi:hypothetical protein
MHTFARDTQTNEDRRALHVAGQRGPAQATRKKSLETGEAHSARASLSPEGSIAARGIESSVEATKTTIRDAGFLILSKMERVEDDQGDGDQDFLTSLQRLEVLF